jgi:tRNA U34 5-methylaminomethyl-2-thiouridine-forming methyltransferase MnmC
MDDMLRAQQAFPGLSDLVEELAPKWSGLPQIDLPELRFRLIIGDARLEVPRWDGLADAWFLDGFSPAKNPELWEAPLLALVFDPTAPQGTAATCTAAGEVRRRLQTVGFTVERTSGFGRKRHMTRARMEA